MNLITASSKSVAKAVRTRSRYHNPTSAGRIDDGVIAEDDDDIRIRTTTSIRRRPAAALVYLLLIFVILSVAVVRHLSDDYIQALRNNIIITDSGRHMNTTASEKNKSHLLKTNVNGIRKKGDDVTFNAKNAFGLQQVGGSGAGKKVHGVADNGASRGNADDSSNNKNNDKDTKDAGSFKPQHERWVPNNRRNDDLDYGAETLVFGSQQVKSGTVGRGDGGGRGRGDGGDSVNSPNNASSPIDVVNGGGYSAALSTRRNHTGTVQIVNAVVDGDSDQDLGHDDFSSTNVDGRIKGFENITVLPEWLQSVIYERKRSSNVLIQNRTTVVAPPLFLKWECGIGMCGGLGDRLSGIIQTFYMSICTNRTLFYVDWPIPVPLEQYLQPNYIPWLQHFNPEDDDDKPDTNVDDENGTTTFLIKGVDKPNTTYIHDASLLPKKRNVTIRTNYWTGEEEILNQTCMRHIKKEIEKHPDHGDGSLLYRYGFGTLFRFTKLVLDETYKKRQQLGLVGRQRHYVGVHVRTGRGKLFKDMKRESNNETTWVLYYQCALRLQRGIEQVCGDTDGEKNEGAKSSLIVPIYLASDTSDTKEEFLKWGNESAKNNSSEANNIRTIKDMEIYHIDKTIKTRLSDAQQAQIDVWTDMKLLMDSTCLVIGEGKFSRLANWLGIQPRCAVYWKDCTNEGEVQKALSRLRSNGSCK